MEDWMKFRRRTEIVDAVQWWPPGHSQHVPIEGVEKGPREDQTYGIVTAFGWMGPLMPGDWIIRRKTGAVSIHGHESFVNEYEEVREHAAAPVQLASMPEREFQDLEGDAMP
jgi:hypothetical protein